MDPSRRRPPPPRISINPHSPSIAPDGQLVLPGRSNGANETPEVDVNLMEKRCKYSLRYLLLRLGSELACKLARMPCIGLGVA